MTKSGGRRTAVSQHHDEGLARIRDLKLTFFAFNARVMTKPRRNPLVQIALIVLVSVLGIGSRRYAHTLPGFIAAYAGDTLWAMAAFLGFGLVLPRASTRTVALLAMAFSIAIEVSQLYHAPWIDSIRHDDSGRAGPWVRLPVERPGLLRCWASGSASSDRTARPALPAIHRRS